MKKRNIITILTISVFFLIVITVFGLLNKETINSVYNNNYKSTEEDISISYEVYEPANKNDIKALVEISAANKLEYVKCPNDTIIYCNGKNKIAFDYTFMEYENYLFKIKEINQDEIEKNISATIPIKTINLSKDFDFSEIGKTFTISATVLPATATNKNLIWSSSNPEIATINNAGEITGISKGVTTITVSNGEDEAIGELIINVIESAPTVELMDGSICEITSRNISDLIGTQIKYNCQAGGTWRIFYLDKTSDLYPNGKYGDCSETKRYCLYIKRDDDSNLKLRKVTKDNYTNSLATIWLGKFNPLWKSKNGVINTTSEKATSYLCCYNEWTSYCNTNVANYAIGSPSLEMYIDSYNQWKGSTKLNYKFEDGKNGYTVGANGTFNANKYYETDEGTVEPGPNSIFITNGSHYIFLASPSRFNNDCIYLVNCWSGASYKYISSFNDNTYRLHPVACLK